MYIKSKIGKKIKMKFLKLTLIILSSHWGIKKFWILDFFLSSSLIFQDILKIRVLISSYLI